jgi:hypothetical protein
MSDDQRFYVFPPVVEKFAKVLNNLIEDGQQAQRYVLENVYYNIKDLPNTAPGDRLHGFGVMFSEARKALEEVHHKLAENYQHLWQATQASSYELYGVAKYYKETDYQAAMRLDRNYPEGRR